MGAVHEERIPLLIEAIDQFSVIWHFTREYERDIALITRYSRSHKVVEATILQENLFCHIDLHE